MPCVLQSLTQEELDKWWESASNPLSPDPLFIRYKCGYVPIGVFPAMIANLAGQESLHMIYDQIKKNHVHFLFGNNYDRVILTAHPKYYAIHLPTVQTPAEVCYRVRKLVESTLKSVVSHMNYSFEVEYQLAFECPDHQGREHLCIVESKEVVPNKMLCLGNINNPEPKKMQAQHLVWFEMVNYYCYNNELYLYFISIAG